MVAAIPVLHDGTIFTNAGYAPFFVLYEIAGVRKKRLGLVANPRAALPHDECTSSAECSCPASMVENSNHILSHYYLIEILHTCDVVLVKFICEHTRRIFDYVGLATYKIPPIIRTERHAIDNYIQGRHYETHL